MKIIECEQGSDIWFDAKRGICSASNFDKIITAQGKPSKQRTKYLYKLAGEKVSGITEETYKSEAMARGNELENEARLLYEFQTGSVVKEVGFCIHTGFGCSPDGLVKEDGLLEIKCPIMSTHVGYLLNNKLPVEYFQQIQGQLLVTNRKWVDFMSYYPAIRPLIIRITRDEEFLKALELELNVFCRELEEITNKIK